MFGTPFKRFVATGPLQIEYRKGLKIRAKDPTKPYLIATRRQSPYDVELFLRNVEFLYIDIKTHFAIPQYRVNQAQLGTDRLNFHLQGRGETTFKFVIPKQLVANFREVLVNEKRIPFDFAKNEITFKVSLSKAKVTLLFSSLTTQMGFYASQTFLYIYLISLLRIVFPK